MIKKLLNEISIDIYRSEDRHNNYRRYAQMRDHPGWKVHQMFMIMIANKMSEYMLSSQFTKLSIEEKDANQRAMHMAKEIIDFLFDPLKGANKLAKALAHNKKLGATQRTPKETK